jgi:hypothetical protein
MFEGIKVSLTYAKSNRTDYVCIWYQNHIRVEMKRQLYTSNIKNNV